MSHHLIHAFLSWWGLALLAALDASIVFTFPIALDVIVVAMSSIHREYFWVCPIVATVGSLVGAASSIAVGRLVGEKGVERFVPRRYFAQIQARVSSPHPWPMVFVPLMPPPFPLTAVIVAAGALKARAARVLIALGGGLLVRFTLESCLALVYGRRIVRWIDSNAARDIAEAMIVIMVACGAYSLWRIVQRERAAQRTEPRRAGA